MQINVKDFERAAVSHMIPDADVKKWTFGGCEHFSLFFPRLNEELVIQIEEKF
jgi:hypothetical protein